MEHDTAIFNRDAFMPGDFLHVQNVNGKFSAKQRKLTGSVGSHDALLLNSYELGESTMKPPIAHVTLLSEYEQKARYGEILISVLRIPNLTMEERYAIATAYRHHVIGTFYDFGGIFKLWMKERLLSWIPDDSRYWNRALGWEWAHWCTEGLKVSVEKAAELHPSIALKNPFAKKRNPTPRTIENRWRDGKLVDVSGEVLTDEGLKHRLIIPESA